MSRLLTLLRAAGDGSVHLYRPTVATFIAPCLPCQQDRQSFPGFPIAQTLSTAARNSLAASDVPPRFAQSKARLK
jgi:hypothetical protein